ncbi:MAG: DNA-directed RNA polymerase subunit alpha C-terminal domain-containing protein [Anaerolineales bacterium]
MQARKDYLETQSAREAERVSPELPINELELGKRVESTLDKEGILNVGQILERLADGEDALLSIDGFGRKSLADVKRALKRHGFELPEAAVEPKVS